MVKFKVGEKIFAKNVYGQWHPGKIIDHNNFREPGMEYAVDLERFPGEAVFVGEDEISLAEPEEKRESKEDNRMKDELLEQLEKMKESLTFTTDEVSAFTLEHFQDDRQQEIILNITIKKENK